MSAYLPKDSANNFPYSDGGGLYALGLIHANHGGEIIDYLFNQLKDEFSADFSNNTWFKNIATKSLELLARAD